MLLDRIDPIVPQHAPLFLVVIASLYTIKLVAGSLTRRPHLPPGPRGLPLVGSVLSVNSKEPWISYTEWGKVYGPIVYSRLLNKDTIIINSEKVAKDLLDRRSGIFSDRPYLATMALFGWTWNFGFFQYGDRWRQCRRLFHQVFRLEASFSYRPVQIRKVHQLLLNLMETPHKYEDHMQTLSSSIIMAITYGYDTAPHHDPLVKIVEETLNLGLAVLTPEGAAILNAFPYLTRLPSWFPGAGFQKKAQRSRDSSMDMVEAPFRHVTQNMSSGTLPPCVCSDYLERTKRGNMQYDEQTIKYVAATAFNAGSETTASALLVFILAMLEFPEIQARAQAEIDAVVGRERLPDFNDRASLPYIDALARETLRWHPILPLGIAHAATTSEVYEGYYIPKGATVIVNAWAMSHDENIYPDPFEFKPERFLVDGKLNDDTVNYAFGYARRVCPGQHLAIQSLWAAMSSVLSVFNIKRAKDELGNEIVVEALWTNGLTAHPHGLQCVIEPRSPGMNAEKLAVMMSFHA